MAAIISRSSFLGPFAAVGGVRSRNAPTLQSIAYGGAAHSTTNSWLYSRVFVSGSALKDANGFIAANHWQVNDSVDASTPLFHDAFLFVHRVGGGKGAKRSIHVDLGVTSAPAETDTGRDFNALLSEAYASVNTGGTGTFTTEPNDGYKGGLYGGNDHPRLASGATYWRIIEGREINVEVESGASVFSKIGLFIVKGGNDASQAVGNTDAAIAIADKASSTVAWKKGLLFGAEWGAWAFNSSSTLIGTQRAIYPSAAGAPSALYGVDFSDLSITAGGSAFLGPLITPASASATGKAGAIVWDANYIYICTATDTWKRVAIATWP